MKALVGAGHCETSLTAVAPGSLCSKDAMFVQVCGVAPAVRAAQGAGGHHHRPGHRRGPVRRHQDAQVDYHHPSSVSLIIIINMTAFITLSGTAPHSAADFRVDFASRVN